MPTDSSLASYFPQTFSGDHGSHRTLVWLTDVHLNTGKSTPVLLSDTWFGVWQSVGCSRAMARRAGDGEAGGLSGLAGFQTVPPSRSESAPVFCTVKLCRKSGGTHTAVNHTVNRPIHQDPINCSWCLYKQITERYGRWIGSLKMQPFVSDCNPPIPDYTFNQYSNIIQEGSTTVPKKG